MCDPLTVAATATVAAGGASIYANNQQAKFQQRQANFNAEVGEIRAVDIERQGVLDADNALMQARRLMGTQRAALGAGNVEGGSGSAAALLEDSAMFAELDALTIRNNAARNAWAARVGAEDSRLSGRMARAGATNRNIGTILTTGAQVAGMYVPGGS